MNLKKKAAEGFVEGAAVEVSKWIVGGLIVSIPVYGAAVLGFARENIINPILEHPWAFAAVLVLGILVGFTAGMLIRHLSLKKARAAITSKESVVVELEKAAAVERKKAEDGAAEKDERIADLESELQEIKAKANTRSVQVNKFERFKDSVPEADVARIRDIPHADKAMIKAVAFKEFVFCKTDQTYDFFLSDINRFVETETLRNGVSRLRPTEKLRRLAKERGDAFSAVNDVDLALHDRSIDFDVEQAMKGYPSSAVRRTRQDGRDWWWVHDPKHAEAFL